MLNPKFAGEDFRRSPDLDPNRRERRGALEPRAFAPTGLRHNDRWGTRAIWPESWERLPPEAFIRAPEASAVGEITRDRALIVIPCLNEAGVIESVIRRILADDALVEPLIIVADGGSSDGSRDIVKAMAAHDGRVRLLPNPARLQSAGVNLAARAMGTGRPWMIRVDAHADYPKNYVSTLIAEARRTGAQSVVVAMETCGETTFQRAAAAAQNSRLGTGGAAHRVGARAGWVDHGHHALFSLAAFEAVGGYDESFSHNEDAELDLRLAGQGGRIWLTDRTRIVYHPRRTPAALWRQYVSYGKGRARTVLKHRARLKLRQALPLAVAPAVLALLAAPLLWPLALPALTWTIVVLAYGAALGLRSGDPAAFLAGPAAMIMHLGWSAGFWRQLGVNLLGLGTPRPRSRARLSKAPS